MGCACAALLAEGCLMQANYEVQYTAADGVLLDVPLSAKFKVEARDDAVVLANFQFMPNLHTDPRTMGYVFTLRILGGRKATKVVVEDDTEAPILEILTDASPKMVKDDLWFAQSPFYNPADEHMNWISSLDNGVRVYRFTVTLNDGSVHVLHAPIFVPGEAKAMFRNELGVK